MNKIFLSSPHMGGNEISYINQAFESNWIAPLGPNLDKFEEKISNYLGPNKNMYSAALSSGTAALHLALKILNIQAGDIVLVQSFTFCGTSNPVSYLGGTIVFIDSEMNTWNICPDSLEEALNKYKNHSIKAIIPVHLYGMPAKMDKIISLSIKYQVPIVEDAAEAFGSTFKGQACGSMGEMSILSFNGNKIITTSGGGALVSTKKDHIDKAKFLSTQARDPFPHYEHSCIGYNYRLSNVLAGIGIGQMEVLDERVIKKREINKLYREYFKDFEGIKFQNEPNSDYYSNYWLTTIIIDPKFNYGINREDLRQILELEGIESRPLWKPLHLQPIHKNTDFIGNDIAENLFNNGLCLPSGTNLIEKDFSRIFKALNKIFKRNIQLV